MDTYLIELRLRFLETLLINTKAKKVAYLSSLKDLIETIEHQKEKDSDKVIEQLNQLYNRIINQKPL